jgi:SAM-dependent methyltransferase
VIAFPLRALILQYALLTSVCLAQVPNTAAPAPVRPDVIFLSTPPAVVDLMLRTAKVSKEDVVYDLGCGDGRLVTLAAKNFGARGVGIDIDPTLIAEARNFAAAAKVPDKVEFRQADMFKSDFRDATVITLYLQDHLNVRLRPMILAQVKPGTRIVSHSFRMGDWPPAAERSIPIGGVKADVFLWVVPANVSGRWKTSSQRNVSDLPPTFVIDQEFDRFTIRRSEGGEIIGDGMMTGKDVTVTIISGTEKKRLTFTGSLEGNHLTASSAGSKPISLKAEREAGTEQPLEKLPQ